ncbi:MAG: ABC transporter permease [Ignavibacteriaceae bacterium]
MIRRTLSVIKKEFLQLKRDTRFLFVLFFFPVLLLVIFGYAINFDVKHIKVAIYDQEKSDLSRDFIRSITNSEYFDFTYNANSEQEINRLLDEKVVQFVIVIPSDFSSKFDANEEVKIQYIIDGVNSNTGTIIKNYITAATASFNGKLQGEVFSKRAIKKYEPINLELQFWFNPDLQTTKFLVPGLIAMILIVTAVISVSLSLVKEKEKGTTEQINVSSLSSFELLTGKVFPFILIALANAAIILIASYFLFDVTLKGSFILLFITTLIFLAAATSLGIFISVISESQQVAFSIATFATLLPAIILSGFVFPIDGMPFLVQIITNITPAKFYNVILRAIILRGVGLPAFWQQIIYLLLFTSFFGGLSVLISKRKLNAQ